MSIRKRFESSLEEIGVILEHEVRYLRSYRMYTFSKTASNKYTPLDIQPVVEEFSFSIRLFDEIILIHFFRVIYGRDFIILASSMISTTMQAL